MLCFLCYIAYLSCHAIHYLFIYSVYLIGVYFPPIFCISPHWDEPNQSCQFKSQVLSIMCFMMYRNQELRCKYFLKNLTCFDVQKMPHCARVCVCACVNEVRHEVWLLMTGLSLLWNVGRHSRRSFSVVCKACHLELQRAECVRNIPWLTFPLTRRTLGINSANIFRRPWRRAQTSWADPLVTGARDSLCARMFSVHQCQGEHCWQDCETSLKSH